MNEQQTLNWRQEVQEKEQAYRSKYPKRDKLTLKDGDMAQIEFMDEGKQIEHPTFGKSVVFEIKNLDDGKQYPWFVKNAFLLESIMGIATSLVGKRIRVIRTGEKMDTKYTIKVLPAATAAAPSNINIPSEEIKLTNHMN